jgi:hypothetical protein
MTTRRYLNADGCFHLGSLLARVCRRGAPTDSQFRELIAAAESVATERGASVVVPSHMTRSGELDTILLAAHHFSTEPRPDSVGEIAAERDRLRAENAELLAALREAYDALSRDDVQALALDPLYRARVLRAIMRAEGRR